jgi:hypothetical protein
MDQTMLGPISLQHDGVSLSVLFNHYSMLVHSSVAHDIITYQLASISNTFKKKEQECWSSSWLFISLPISVLLKACKLEILLDDFE